MTGFITTRPNSPGNAGRRSHGCSAVGTRGGGHRPENCVQVMNANDDTPRKGESVTVEPVSKRDARQRFLQSNLQLIADRLHHVRSGVGEREPGDLRRELQEVRAEVAAVEEMLPTRTLDELGELTEWRCRYCGNVMLRKGRPTRCLQCRRGEHENGEEPLTEKVDRP